MICDLIIQGRSHELFGIDDLHRNLPALRVDQLMQHDMGCIRRDILIFMLYSVRSATCPEIR